MSKNINKNTKKKIKKDKKRLGEKKRENIAQITDNDAKKIQKNHKK